MGLNVDYGSFIGIHGLLLGAYLAYYFKFSERKKDFFETTYNSILKTKNLITKEIAEQFTKILKPMPNIFLDRGTEGQEGVHYIEGVSNPAKTEKFKNWLDDYLKEKDTFIIRYGEIKSMYLSWKRWSKLLKNLSAAFSVIELILIFILFQNNKALLKIDILLTDLDITLALSVLLFITGLSLVVYTDNIEDKLRKIKEKNAKL